MGETVVSSINIKSVGQQIYWARRNQHISQQDLAKKVGIPANSLGSIENGRTKNADIRLINVINEVLGLDKIKDASAPDTSSDEYDQTYAWLKAIDFRKVNLSLLIKAKRAETNVSRNIMAKAIGVTAPYYSQCESGCRIPKKYQATLIKELRITEQEVMDFLGEKSPEYIKIYAEKRKEVFVWNRPTLYYRNEIQHLEGRRLRLGMTIQELAQRSHISVYAIYNAEQHKIPSDTTAKLIIDYLDGQDNNMPDIQYFKLVNILRDERLSQHITIDELAKRIEKSRSTLLRYEELYSKIPLMVLNDMAIALGLPRINVSYELVLEDVDVPDDVTSIKRDKFSTLIRTKRLLKNLSKSELACMCKLDNEVIHNIETNKLDPSRSCRITIARALGLVKSDDSKNIVVHIADPKELVGTDENHSKIRMSADNPKDRTLLRRAMLLGFHQGKLSINGIMFNMSISHDRAARILNTLDDWGFFAPKPMLRSPMILSINSIDDIPEEAMAILREDPDVYSAVEDQLAHKPEMDCCDTNQTSVECNNTKAINEKPEESKCNESTTVEDDSIDQKIHDLISGRPDWQKHLMYEMLVPMVKYFG